MAERHRGLYAITPEEPDTGRLLSRASAVLAARPALLQYRNKTADAALREAQAHALQSLCAAAAVPLIINDDAALAARIGAAGVHLGRDDGEIEDARVLLGERAIIGVSCYADLQAALRAERAGASYVALGSVFASTSKPQAPRVSLDQLKAARHALQLPMCAIGGIRLADAPMLIDIGIDLLAVISDVFDAPDPGVAAAAFARLFPG